MNYDQLLARYSKTEKRKIRERKAKEARDKADKLKEELRLKREQELDYD